MKSAVGHGDPWCWLARENWLAGQSRHCGGCSAFGLHGGYIAGDTEVLDATKVSRLYIPTEPSVICAGVLQVLSILKMKADVN